MKSGRSLILFFILLLSCAAPQWWVSVPGPDKARWNRCFEPMRATLGCDAGKRAGSAMEILISDSTCMSYQMPIREYARQQDSAARKTWLRAHGCPASMVEPGP